jgi:hypothetical protein
MVRLEESSESFSDDNRVSVHPISFSTSYPDRTIVLPPELVRRLIPIMTNLPRWTRKKHP